MRTLVSRIAFHMKGARRASICSSMSVARTGIGDGRRDARRTLDPTPVAYLDRRRLRQRIHGRPRSDRKKRFLLSAVAPSTITRHPREAKPINWAQRGGLASGREMSADAEATFHRASCTLGNQVVAASDGVPFRQERRPTRVCRTPGAGSGLLAEASTPRAG
jgi:hypothetical protein